MSASKESDFLERLPVSAGSVILREGEKGDCAYLVQSGRVRVTVSREGKQVELAQMGAGEIIGEMALVEDTIRSASVEAMIDTNLIVLNRDLIAKKLAKSDPTIRALLPMLMHRLTQTNDALLNKAESMESLIGICHVIYNKVEQGLPANQKKTLSNIVKPKMDEFIEAITAFEKRYHEEYKDGS